MVEIIVGFAVLTMIVLLSGLRVVNEYERLVVFRLGKVQRESRAGLRLVVPYFEKGFKIDIRAVSMPIPAQEAITRDNISVKISAICLFQVDDCIRSVTRIEDPVEAVSQIAQAVLRKIVGEFELDEVLSSRDMINARLKNVIDSHTRNWGINVSSVEVRDLQVPERMQRSIARQAESERLRRARVIASEGEAQAAPKLADAARVLSSEEGALGLRQIQTILDIAEHSKSSMVLPFPVELFSSSNSPNEAEVEIVE